MECVTFLSFGCYYKTIPAIKIAGRWAVFRHTPGDDPKIRWAYYPLVNIQKAIENGPVEIVDLPSYKMVMFHSYVSLPEGTTMHPKKLDSSLLRLVQGSKHLPLERWQTNLNSPEKLWQKRVSGDGCCDGNAGSVSFMMSIWFLCVLQSSPWFA